MSTFWNRLYTYFYGTLEKHLLNKNMEIKTNCYCTGDLQQMNHKVKPKEIIAVTMRHLRKYFSFFPLHCDGLCETLNSNEVKLFRSEVLTKNFHFCTHLFPPSVNCTETFAKTCFTPPNLGTFYHVQSTIINNLLANNLQTLTIHCLPDIYLFQRVLEKSTVNHQYVIYWFFF